MGMAWRQQWWAWWWLACWAAEAGGATPGRPLMHPVLAALRDEPASPRPSLRSQLRGAATDLRGRAGLQVDSLLCTNDLANHGALDEQTALRRVQRRVLGGRPPPARHILLLVDLQRDTAVVYLQGVPVELHGPGDVVRSPGGVVVVAVVHPATGRLLRHYRHPAKAQARPLQAFLRSLQPGRVLLLVGSTLETPEPSVTSLLAELGIHRHRGGGGGAVLWAWVGVVGGEGAAGEASITWRHPNRQRLTWEIYLEKAPEAPWCGRDTPPAWEEGGRWAARAELCAAHDGYGAWCTCPPPPPPPPQVAATWHSEGAVTVILASHPTALHRLLVSLAAAGGASRDVLVFTGQQQAPRELQLVCKSHGVHFEVTGRASDCMGLHVARLYESALTATLILRPKASFITALEDDMVVLPSFYRWMEQGRKILNRTLEFICVNSLNPKYPYKLHQYPPRTQNHSHPSRRPWDATTTATHSSRSPDKPRRDNKRSPDKKTASGDTLRGPRSDTRTPRGQGVVTGGGSRVEVEGRRWSGGGAFMAGWGAERTLVEAMIRFWPLAKRDVDWEALVMAWAGSRPCLTPTRPHALHARAAHFSLGPDLPPLT